MGARTNVKREGDCGERTRELIARHYLEWMEEFYNSDDRRLFLSMDGGDMFNHAIALILQDSKFQSCKTDEEITSNIRRRIGNVITEIKRDHQLLISKHNADNQQTDKIADEEERGEAQGAHGHLQLRQMAQAAGGEDDLRPVVRDVLVEGSDETGY